MDRKLENFRIFEAVIKCKWTLSLLDKISSGIKRPGELKRSIRGISAKVMYERLKKLERFNLIQRKKITSKPLKVCYSLTPFGKKFVKILNLIKNLR